MQSWVLSTSVTVSSILVAVYASNYEGRTTMRDDRLAADLWLPPAPL
jgi:hypothetical protein